MITGRKIANGNAGKGEASAWKTPLTAALQATANQSVNGTMTDSQVARRWPEVRSAPSRPSHKPTPSGSNLTFESGLGFRVQFNSESHAIVDHARARALRDVVPKTAPIAGAGAVDGVHGR